MGTEKPEFIANRITIIATNKRWAAIGPICYFMVRQQVLRLYRNVLRAIKQVPDEQTRKELRDWARSDFRTHKNQTDEYAIKMLLYHGEQQLKQLRQNIAFSR